MARGFLIIPFEGFDTVSDSLRDAVEESKHKLHRLDDRHKSNWLSLQLMRELDRCDFAIAVLEGENPNVMWETGYVFSQRKPVLLISSDPVSEAADIRGFTMLVYDPTDLEALKEGVKSALPDVLGRDIGEYSRIWVSSLMKAARKASAAILKSEPDFDDEAHYLRYLVKRVTSLKRGQRVRAVCGKKDWSGAWVKRYFEVNGEAAKFGVDIERLFVLTDEETKEAAAQHSKLDVQVRVVPQAHLSSLTTAVMPPDLGFAILDETEVVVHWKEKGGIRGAHFIDSGNIDQFRRVYSELRELSEELPSDT